MNRKALIVIGVLALLVIAVGAGVAWNADAEGRTTRSLTRDLTSASKRSADAYIAISRWYEKDVAPRNIREGFVLPRILWVDFCDVVLGQTEPYRPDITTRALATFTFADLTSPEAIAHCQEYADAQDAFIQAANDFRAHQKMIKRRGGTD